MSKRVQMENGSVALRALQSPVFTIADLEEGLRIARETPVFTARDKYGNVLVFQKRDAGVFYRTKEGTEWVGRVDRLSLNLFTPDELEAIAKAMRS